MAGLIRTAGNTLEVFDLWQEPGAGLSFAAGEEAEAPRWRLDLGDDPGGAGQRLTALETQTRQALSHFDAVPGRLDNLLRRARPRPDAEVSLSAAAVPAPGEDLADAERDFLLWTGEMRAEVSFAASEGPRVDPGRLRAEVTGATRRLSRLLTHMAWVETRTGDQISQLIPNDGNTPSQLCSGKLTPKGA